MTPTPEMEKILAAEADAFRAQLPQLLKKHEGKWAVFRDAKPVTFCDDYEDALISGIERFGRGAVFLIAAVTSPRRTLIPLRTWRMPSLFGTMGLGGR